MDCDAERANLGLLETLLEIATDTAERTGFDVVIPHFSDWVNTCVDPEDPISPSVSPPINFFMMIRFLDNFESGELGEDCQQALDDLLDQWREWQAQIAFRNAVRETLTEARNRYAKCLHDLKGGVA